MSIVSKKHHHPKHLKRNVTLAMMSEWLTEMRLFFPVAVLGFQSLTGSYTMAMSVFAFASLTAAMLEIPTGILSDKWGRRGTWIVGALGELMAVFCYTLAFWYPAFVLPLLYTGSLFYGLANALYSGNNHAMLYDTLACYRREKQIATVLGRVSSMGQMGLGTAGLCAGSLLWLGATYETLLIISLVFLSANVLIAFLTIEPPRHYVKEDGSSLKHMKKALKLITQNGKLRLYAIASIIQRGAGQANYYFSPSFIESVWPLWLTPIYRTLQHSFGATGFWYAGKFIKRFGGAFTLLYGTALSQIASLIAYALSSVFSPLLLMATQLSYGLCTTADNTVQQENFSDAQRATMGSLISFGSAIMTALMAIVTGFISDHTGPAIAIGGTLFARALIVNAIYFKLYKTHK